MKNHETAPASGSDIPIIDITALRDGSDEAAVARALFAASRDHGFLYVSGHGVPASVLDAARDEAFAFFRGTALSKSAVMVSARHRGWLGQGGSRMRDDVPPDLKESFIWGLEETVPLDDHPLRGENQWPSAQPGLRAAALDWFTHATVVARHLLRGFAIGLEVAPDCFLRHVERPLSRASFVWYPPADASEANNAFGVGPHTDFGVLTVLCQDDVGGLEVQGVDGQWQAASPVEGTLVVNVADLLARWTNGACRSTPHRVVNRSGRERLSLVLAFDPEPGTRVDSRDVVGEDVPGQPEPITCGDYLVERFARAFAYRQNAS